MCVRVRARLCVLALLCGCLCPAAPQTLQWYAWRYAAAAAVPCLVRLHKLHARHRLLYKLIFHGPSNLAYKSDLRAHACMVLKADRELCRQTIPRAPDTANTFRKAC